MKASGWSQAEVARRLQITPGAVSQFCSGKILPKAGTLNLFKYVLAKFNPAAIQAYEKALSKSEAPWKQEIVEMLDRLTEKDRQLVLKPIIELLKIVAALRRKS